MEEDLSKYLIIENFSQKNILKMCKNYLSVDPGNVKHLKTVIIPGNQKIVRVS